LEGNPAGIYAMSAALFSERVFLNTKSKAVLTAEFQNTALQFEHPYPRGQIG